MLSVLRTKLPASVVRRTTQRTFAMSSARSQQSLLISPKDLNDKLKSPNLRIIDATWFMPGTPRDPKAEFLKGPRIARAAGFWDVDDVADKDHPLGLKHMIPSPQVFADACSKLGISRDSEVVVYDTHSVFSAPRTAFTFKAFSHENVFVLDGGLPKWLAEELPTESGDFKTPFEPSNYPAPTFDETTIRSYEQIVKNTQGDLSSVETELVLDARPAGRFTGEAPEPRPGLSSGHMPNSVSLPFNNLRSAPSETTPSYQTIKPTKELKDALLKALGGDEHKLQEIIEGKRSIVNSCGSGMTAAIIWLALQEIGVKSAIYDESWTGYAMRSESKILQS